MHGVFELLCYQIAIENGQILIMILSWGRRSESINAKKFFHLGYCIFKYGRENIERYDKYYN